MLLPVPVSGGEIRLGSVPIRAGEVCHFEAPLSAAEQRIVAEEGNPVVAVARVALATPPGFDPTRSWPVAIVSATSDGSASSVRSVPFYTSAALFRGWVVIGADGPGRPRADGDGWRFAMVAAALDELHRRWPASTRWPLACVGFSGGAKRSALLAALLVRQGAPVIGVFMAGCNEDKATVGLQRYGPDPARFKAVPMFLSGGERDRIAFPADQEKVAASLLHTGFRRVALEHFPGGHEVYLPHFGRALDWFRRESGGAASPGQR